MRRWWTTWCAGLLIVSAGLLAPTWAQQPSRRIALVIGNGAYTAAPLATAANDAGLVAQTLTAAGFDVTGARDLDGDSVRHAFREFLDKANGLGPDGTALVYLSGHALQFDGENYFVPVDATLARDSDIPLQALRLSDFTHALAAVPLQIRVVVLDGAYADPQVPASSRIAPGLALVDADPGSLVAFNAAPGTVGPTPTGSYGVYGQALAEMMREGGVPIAEVFDRVRLRVNTATKGAEIPWDSDKLTAAFVFLDRAADAPASVSAQQSFTAMSRQPIRSFPVDEAYSIAVARDTFPAYEEFLAAYPQSPYARRVRALLAVRREALIWRQTVNRNTAAAYWTYQRRYPRGPHVPDCRRRLVLIAAPFAPPPSFAPIDYDVPPPPEVEEIILDQPAVYLVAADDPPPPPPPLYFLPPEPADFIDLPPPAPPLAAVLLPVPVVIPILLARPAVQPGFLAPPQGVRVQYAQPRPFVTGQNGALVAQPPPANATTPTPAPAPSSAAPPGPAPAPAGVVANPAASPPQGTASPLAPRRLERAGTAPTGSAVPPSTVRPAPSLGAPLPGADGKSLPRPATGSPVAVVRPAEQVPTAATARPRLEDPGHARPMPSGAEPVEKRPPQTRPASPRAAVPAAIAQPAPPRPRSPEASGRAGPMPSAATAVRPAPSAPRRDQAGQGQSGQANRPRTAETRRIAVQPPMRQRPGQDQQRPPQTQPRADQPRRMDAPPRASQPQMQQRAAEPRQAQDRQRALQEQRVPQEQRAAPQRPTPQPMRQQPAPQHAAPPHPQGPAQGRPECGHPGRPPCR